MRCIACARTLHASRACRILVSWKRVFLVLQCSPRNRHNLFRVIYGGGIGRRVRPTTRNALFGIVGDKTRTLIVGSAKPRCFCFRESAREYMHFKWIWICWSAYYFSVRVRRRRTFETQENVPVVNQTFVVSITIYL